MKKIFFLVGALLLAGASCSNPFVTDDTAENYPTDTNSGPVSSSVTSESTPTAPATTPVNTSPTPTVIEPANLPTELTLNTVEALGNQVVKIEFSVPAELAKNATGYRIMMSKDPNPTVENSTDWYELGPAHRSKLWNVNGTGQRYVKVCAVKNDTCAAISSIITVEVK